MYSMKRLERPTRCLMGMTAKEPEPWKLKRFALQITFPFQILALYIGLIFEIRLLKG